LIKIYTLRKTAWPPAQLGAKWCR